VRSDSTASSSLETKGLAGRELLERAGLAQDEA
jgi:hypothetical protein